MSPVHEDACGLALVACILGALLSRMVLASARRSGVYRSRAPERTLIASMHSDAFFLVLQSWSGRARWFAVGAASIAAAWSMTELIAR